MIAAPTTSLPEDIGGVRNWDYRYCWLRDSVLALEALLAAGYTEEALAFRDFLLRVGTGDPTKIQIMYGIGGERRLTEFELDAPARLRGLQAGPGRQRRVRAVPARRLRRGRRGHVHRRRDAGQDRDAAVAALAGHRRARRDDLARARRRDLGGARSAAALHLLQGHGVGRVRPRRATRRAVRAGGARSTAGSRSATRSTARSASGDTTRERRTFTQYYGSKELDASVLNIPLVGFLPGTDERVTGTIDAVSRELGRDGFVSRYSTAETDDGLPGDEGQFLACSFWLVSALARNGRAEEARALFERLIGLANDLGLLAEEYDVGAPAAGRQLPAGVQPPHADPRGARDLRSRGGRGAGGPLSAHRGSAGRPSRGADSWLRSRLPSSSAASRART